MQSLKVSTCHFMHNKRTEYNITSLQKVLWRHYVHSTYKNNMGDRHLKTRRMLVSNFQFFLSFLWRYDGVEMWNSESGSVAAHPHVHCASTIQTCYQVPDRLVSASFTGCLFAVKGGIQCFQDNKVIDSLFPIRGTHYTWELLYSLVPTCGALILLKLTEFKACRARMGDGHSRRDIVRWKWIGKCLF